MSEHEIIPRIDEEDQDSLTPIADHNLPKKTEVSESLQENPKMLLVVFGIKNLSDEDLQSMGVEAHKKEEDKIIIGHPESGQRIPVLGRLRVLGAVEMYLQGNVGDIIFTGGKLAGEDIGSEAELMERYFFKVLKRRLHSDLRKKGSKDDELVQETEKLLAEARGHIHLENESENTTENFAYSEETIDQLIRQNNYQTIGFMSNEYHLDRVMSFNDIVKPLNSTIGYVPISAEPLVSARDARLDRIVQGHTDSKINAELREKIAQEITDPEERELALARLTNINDLMKQERERIQQTTKDTEEGLMYWVKVYHKILKPAKTIEILDEAGIDWRKFASVRDLLEVGLAA